MRRVLNEHANTTVRVSVSSPTSGDSRDDGYVNLRIEDEASGTVLVDTEIEAGRWWRLMQSASQAHPAFVSAHLDRVGKRMENTSVGLGRLKGREDAEAAWAAMDRPDDWADFDSIDFRRTNAGWVAILRRWVTP